MLVRALMLGSMLVGLGIATPSFAQNDPPVDLKSIWNSLTPEEQASYQQAAPRTFNGPVLNIAGDSCAAATHEIGALPFNTADTTVGRADDLTYGAACGGFNASSGVGPDLTYRIQTDITCDLTVNMDPAANDLALWVVSSDCADPVGGCVGGDDSGGNGTAEAVGPFTATAGTDYFVIVDGFGGASDAFTLSIVENTSTGCMLVGRAVPTLSIWVFAFLGVALALMGRRLLRSRFQTLT